MGKEGKFHITDKGETKPCKAGKRTCKYGEHFSNFEEAQRRSDEIQEIVQNGKVEDQLELVKKGYCLDQFANSELWTVRHHVALAGYKPEKMMKDPSEYVRQAVAETGKFCDELAEDESPMVREAALKVLEHRRKEEELKKQRDEYVKNFKPTDDEDKPSIFKYREIKEPDFLEPTIEKVENGGNIFIGAKYNNNELTTPQKARQIKKEVNSYLKENFPEVECKVHSDDSVVHIYLGNIPCSDQMVDTVNGPRRTEEFKKFIDNVEKISSQYQYVRKVPYEGPDENPYVIVQCFSTSLDF